MKDVDRAKALLAETEEVYRPKAAGQRPPKPPAPLEPEPVDPHEFLSSIRQNRETASKSEGDAGDRAQRPSSFAILDQI